MSLVLRRGELVYGVKYNSLDMNQDLIIYTCYPGLISVVSAVFTF